WIASTVDLGKGSITTTNIFGCNASQRSTAGNSTQYGIALSSAAKNSATKTAAATTASSRRVPGASRAVIRSNPAPANTASPRSVNSVNRDGTRMKLKPGQLYTNR